VGSSLVLLIRIITCKQTVHLHVDARDRKKNHVMVEIHSKSKVLNIGRTKKVA